jgi:hypothetical protein
VFIGVVFGVYVSFEVLKAVLLALQCVGDMIQ